MRHPGRLPCVETPSALSPSTLHGLAEAIVSVPYQLGYYPKASLIAICMQRDPGRAESKPTQRGQVALTARVDLGPPEEHWEVLAAIEPALARVDTGLVVLIAFEEGAGHSSDATVLLTKAGALADSHGARVMAAARVRGRRWRHVTSAASLEGWQDLPADEDVQVIADYVMAGRAPAPDRRSVDDLLRPICEELARAVARRYAGTAASDRTAQIGAEGVLWRAARMVATVIGENGRAEPPDWDAEDLLCSIDALDDLGFRDALLHALSPSSTAADDLVDKGMQRIVSAAMASPVEVDSAACVRMAQAAAYVPEDRSAPWLSLVGYLCWQAGEGALANVVITAARAADPDYSLARLVDMALCAAIAPPRPV